MKRTNQTPLDIDIVKFAIFYHLSLITRLNVVMFTSVTHDPGV